MLKKFVINSNHYSIEDNQGIVVRKNGELLADYANGQWTWINPKLDINPRDMDEILPLCQLVEASM